MNSAAQHTIAADFTWPIPEGKPGAQLRIVNADPRYGRAKLIEATTLDYLWYVAETGLTNSIALVPEEGGKSDYAIINWARWDVSPLRHFWTQLTKPSFWRTMPRNLDANCAASMPIYCRLA